MLEDTIEEMSTTFLSLSDSILESEYVRSQPQLISSIGDAVKRALKLAENATRDRDEEMETSGNLDENAPEQSRAQVEPGLAGGVPVGLGQGEPASAATYLSPNEMGMQDSYTDSGLETGPNPAAIPRERSPVPDNIRGMVTQNAFFTDEFWEGDYTGTADMHVVEMPDRPPPFSEHLLRLNLTTVIHRLTRDSMQCEIGFCIQWKARGFQHSLKHKCKAKTLGTTRRVIDNVMAQDASLHAMQRDVTGPIRKQADLRHCFAAYFDNEDLRDFGVATRHSMVLASYLGETLANAEEVKSYLKEKGIAQVKDREMKM